MWLIEKLVFPEIDLTKGSNEYFVQEYIANPLLVDGRKFDIGVYTVLTSIDPLRVYVYDREVLIRFCEKAYYPFDPEDERKYVVGDTYTQPWEVKLRLICFPLEFNS